MKELLKKQDRSLEIVVTVMKANPAGIDFDTLVPTIQEIRKEVLEAVREVIEDERLHGDTGEREDEAYNQALDDILKALDT